MRERFAVQKNGQDVKILTSHNAAFSWICEYYTLAEVQNWNVKIQAFYV